MSETKQSSIWYDYQKVHTIVTTINSPLQYSAALRCIHLFFKKWQKSGSCCTLRHDLDFKLSTRLHEICDENVY